MSSRLVRLLEGGVARKWLVANASAIALVIGVPALAQQAPETTPPAADEAEAAAVENRIVVTGSRIARDAATAPTPLISLEREEILRSGEPNVVDFLADIPALSGSTVPEDTTGGNLNDGGLSLLNLRDLGSVRTLVLVDGRRHVGSSPGSLSVDVDTIPSMLVESVEIVTGGLSSVYGADAVSGVVNFILRKDFEGAELDGSLAEVNQGGQMSRRLSGAIGHNTGDGRLNAYAFAEYQELDEVLDFDIDWRNESFGFFGDDADTSAMLNDGVLDNVLRNNLRRNNRARGGTLVLANQARPSATNDPDTPVANCGSGTTGTLPANCAVIRPENVGTVWTFDRNGVARPFNFGVATPGAGLNIDQNSGGDGINLGTEQNQGSRVPESENTRFQFGLNYDLLPNVSLFGEVKYVDEQTFDSSQPTFFDISIANGAPAGGTSTSAFRIGLDNVFLNEQSPHLVQAILNNTRPVYSAPTATSPGQQTGTILDQRARLGIFGPSRSQLNNRDLVRYVAGASGDLDQVAFLKDVNWELSYTYGEMNNSNLEVGVDSERMYYASDAVRDPTNIAGRGANAIVCRVQITVAQNGSVPDASGRNGGVPLTASDPAIRDCTPISVFGTDFRADADHPLATGGGGRQGMTQAQADYLTAAIEVTDKNVQHSALGYFGGSLWDFWGAGPIASVVGFEFRREETEGTGRDRDRAGRLLFLNSGPDFEKASYEANEIFTELGVPLVKDLDLPFTNFRLLDSAEFTGAYRFSDYSTVGEVETFSTQLTAVPNEHLFFRATFGEATRIPNLGENFRPATQTFGNGLTDPCDPNRIRNLANSTAETRTQLRANCLATMPAGYDPGTDAAGTGTPSTITYTSGIPGFNAGNPLLEPETSTSFTAGFALTPKFHDWLEPFVFTADYYDIEIENVIASVTIQQAMNNCVGILTGGQVGGVNQAACNSFQRSATPEISQQPAFGVFTFIQGSVNYARTLAQGVDFSARYAFDLEEGGDIFWSLRGNYLIRQTDFFNIADPNAPSDFDDSVGLPRVRFLSTLTYAPTDKLAFSWDWDWQASQEILDDSTLDTNGDTRLPDYFRTDPFSQHDFSVRWDPTERLTLRGGVVNATDAEPDVWLGGGTSADNFDLFGRRYFIGANIRY